MKFEFTEEQLEELIHTLGFENPTVIAYALALEYVQNHREENE